MGSKAKKISIFAVQRGILPYTLFRILPSLAETKAYQPIPMIADFTNENGSDSLKETIETNYKRVKREVMSLIELEIERIKTNPSLRYLIKE